MKINRERVTSFHCNRNVKLFQAKLKTESANFIEMLNEAHAKMKQIELRKAYHEFEHDALQRCILELQCISDDKSTIGRYDTFATNAIFKLNNK